MRHSTVIALICLLAPAAAVARSGSIVAVGGAASVERNKEVIPATKGTVLQQGDIVVTGAQGKVQLRMADDSIFVLPASSALRIDEFKYRPSSDQPSPGRAIFSMLRGGLRTITGLVGKTKGDRYEVRAGVATIGIRGSAYAAVTCAGQCPRHRDGVYVSAEKGLILVSNEFGKVLLQPKEIAYVPAEGGPPVKVQTSPFDSPAFVRDFAFELELDIDVDPPRIGPEPPASPSTSPGP